ncbi:MAG: GGDEF domain-containing protein, partial [Acidiferrobacterales bacterium]
MMSANPIQRSIAVRMFVLLAGIFFLTYVSISAIVLTRVSDHLRSTTARARAEDTRLRLASVQRLLAQQATNVGAWAKLNVMNDLVTGDIDGRVGRSLRQMSREYSIHGSLFAFDSAGRLVAASTPVSRPDLRLPESWRPGRSRHVRFLDKSVNPYTGRQAVVFSTPVYAAYPPRPRIGTLVLAYRWKAIKTILSSGNVHLLIEGSDGAPIFSALGGWPPQVVRRAFAHNRLKVGGRTYFVSQVAPGTGVFRLPWEIFDAWSGTNIMTSIRQALEQIAGWGIVLAIPMGLLIGLATRRFIEPIRRLTAAAIDISHSSDVSRRVAVDRSDEIGALQRAFNLMTVRLQKTLDERRQAAESVSELNRSLQKLAMTDVLTGLPNRRAAEARLEEEFAAAQRVHASFSIAFFDLDHFKSVNDRYGHDAGDRVLQHCATTMRDALRAGDWMARWGGEEFLLAFRDADLLQAQAAAERVCEALRAAVIDINGIQMAVRASGGISSLCMTTRDLAQMLSEADHCLYGAKKCGR